MQDNLATGQKLGTHGLPLDLSDCSRARGTLYRDLGRELAQGQRLRQAAGLKEDYVICCVGSFAYLFESHSALEALIF